MYCHEPTEHGLRSWIKCSVLAKVTRRRPAVSTAVRWLKLPGLEWQILRHWLGL